MSDNPEYDIHPLDRDYSQDNQSKPKEKSWHSQSANYVAPMRTVGVIAMGVGLAMVLLSAVALNVVRANSPAENVAGFLNRFAMLVMLFGAIAIFLAYRVNFLNAMREAFNPSMPTSSTTRSGALSSSNSSSSNSGGRRDAVSESLNDAISRGAEPDPFSTLLTWNFWGCSIAAIVILLSIRIGGIALIPLSFLLTTLLCFLVTLGIWHRGFIRAYAIAVIVGSVFNLLIGVSFVSFGLRGLNSALLMLIHLAIIVVSALICSRYVYKLEVEREREREIAEAQEAEIVRD